MTRRLAKSREAAQRAISDGRVEVRGVPEPKAATLVDPDTALAVVPPGPPYVGRGGVKLAAAIDHFRVPVKGRRALDAGAGTGGFVDCLLQRGAAHVTALDVGYGQLDWTLRNDSRVMVLERTNLRHVDPFAVGAPFELVVADLSFISLATVAPALARLGGDDTEYLLLVKPQFELERGRVGKGGIVKDADGHREALGKVIGALQAEGLGTQGLMPSPILGAKGNREFFVFAKQGPTEVGDEEVERTVSG